MTDSKQIIRRGRGRPSVKTYEQRIKQAQQQVVPIRDRVVPIRDHPDRDDPAVTVKKTRKRFSGKQERFVQEYMIDFNATQAALRAGYAPRRVDQIGYENLRKPEIQERIQKLKDKIANKLEITAEKVLLERAEIAFAKTNQLYNGVKITACDKNKALDALDRYLGLYERDNVQKGEVTQEVKNVVISELLRNIAAKQTTLPSQQPKLLSSKEELLKTS